MRDLVSESQRGLGLGFDVGISEGVVVVEEEEYCRCRRVDRIEEGGLLGLRVAGSEVMRRVERIVRFLFASIFLFLLWFSQGLCGLWGC